jgi:hypothetical protein
VKRALFALVVCVLASCQSNHHSKPESSGLGGVGLLTGVPIPGVLHDIDEEHAELLRVAMRTVPSPLPPEAVSLVKFLEGARGSKDGIRVEAPVQGTLRTSFVVADPGTNSVNLNLLCLLNFQQIACSSQSLVWQITLPPSTVVRAPVDMPVRDGDRLDFLIMVSGDLKRPKPVSSEVPVLVGSQTSPAERTARDGAIHAAVFEGCNFATIQPETLPQKLFHRPGEQRLSRALFLIVQLPCADRNGVGSEIIHAVEVVDRTKSLTFPGLDSPVRVTGSAFVVKIPRLAALHAGSELQIIVFRERVQGWVTHPVKFVA